MQIVPMTAAYAAEVVTWRYPPPCDLAAALDTGGGLRRVVQSLGFGQVASFHATADGRSYEILTRPEDTPL